MKTTLFYILVTLPMASFGQMYDSETLNGNSVSAEIGDNGMFFFQPQSASTGYEVPAGSGKSTIYSAGFWCGAVDVNSQLHASKASIGSQTGGFGSGPIADPTNYGTNAYINAYGVSVWKVTRQEVENHILDFQQQGYVLPSSLANWPGNGDVSLGVAAQLAPFVDLNGDGIYDPQAGDYPDFPGDEVVYTIYNDQSYMPDGNALGIEVHMMFYHYATGNYLDETTFLNVRVFNRSTVDYYDFKQAIYLDMDIGNYDDDFLGCDSTRSVFFTYNGDQFDEDNAGSLGYGSHPPCQAVMSLNQPMTAFLQYTNGINDDFSDLSVWNNLNGLKGDGTPLLDPLTMSATSYMFSGNPFTQTGWNMDTSTVSPGDIRGFHVIAPGDLPAGSMQCSDYAFIYDDTDGYLENVQNVLYTADALQTLYDSSDNFGCQAFTLGLKEVPSQPLEFSVYPNPSKGVFSLQVDELPLNGTITVTDLTGKMVYTTSLQKSITTITLEPVSGYYLITVAGDNYRAVKQLVIE